MFNRQSDSANVWIGTIAKIGSAGAKTSSNTASEGTLKKKISLHYVYMTSALNFTPTSVRVLLC
jgi:hypothetical protein